MDLTLLTSPELIHLNSHFSSRERAIAFLVQQLDQQGILDNAKDFLQAVTERENEGPTALGEGLAVPHGKSASVRRAAFALATLENPLPWQGVDGEEPVNMIFLLAIPEAEAGSTHMELLTALTTRLVDDDTRAALMVARHVQEVLALLGAEPATETPHPQILPDDAPRVVCVTACPAGIAHTYMAAEYLEKAAKKLGIHIDVEKQGANGIENAITAAQCDRAVACVFAAEVAIKDSQRFDGIPCVQVPVAEPIRHAEAVLQQALAIRRQPGETVASAPVNPQKTSIKADLKQALLSGISFAVPLIVAGGSLLAVTVLIAQLFGWQELYAQKASWLWMYRQLGGGMLGILMVPVLSAYTAYSLADKPALTPGFAAGLCANMIGAGFLGGVAGGLIAGYVMRWMKKHVRLRASFNGFLMFYLYPVLGTLATGSIMLFVIGEPVAWLNSSLTAWLNGLSGSNAMVLGAMANGVYGPYAIFGATKMVSAFTVTASTLLAPHLFKSFEIETGKSTWLLGLAGITEGAIPMAIEDPLRVIGSFLAGSVVTGAIVGASGIGLSTPGAGIFSMFLLHDGGWGGWLSAAIWLGAALAGTVISTLVLLSWRGYAVRQGHFTGDIPSS
ncbi:HrsA family PTS system IIABC components [Rahnella aquatilis CIP 78.65 = ATCC 33071]|uniref:PTS system, fructose-specific, IIB component/PTS system, fructose subfamily, IIA component n=1 Tax=Rahnella aquatilis (strain ATCC 33071 / DSM 4594 / JCM 1683 / NBRC 105701 / NCIMB 13365 / CIP 78.65) TaxID=745277 RepID=H2IW49_RAHAC|nr:fructose PTS transporter subunit IIA [Rahnella aquatilis]AEX50718.1 PTS system, fructose-specific, IIB component/PTS system, fructose subfamily, IIA component [Rahnella aquatilis CIP 78.65 = ATCC 33071]KFD01781.1 HrsA family PTS system IIABC components [Rahnella aquatilis CIP 78.65 = ATCC 33071]